ncbi:hypothetical protein L1887_57364 [Cichorium endivia]|nr:hypothetical protein L1887_57364 [Cichorium endivia]
MPEAPVPMTAAFLPVQSIDSSHSPVWMILPLNFFHAWNLGDVDLGGEPEAEDDVLRRDSDGLILARACGQRPLLCSIVPVRAAHAVIEAAILAQLELLVKVVEVLAKLLEVGILAREVPRPPDLREREAVQRDLAIDSSSRVLRCLSKVTSRLMAAPFTYPNERPTHAVEPPNAAKSGAASKRCTLKPSFLSMYL